MIMKTYKSKKPIIKKSPLGGKNSVTKGMIGMQKVIARKRLNAKGTKKKLSGNVSKRVSPIRMKKY